MNRLLERFDGFRLHLLAPDGADRRERPSGFTVADVRGFREQVYVEHGCLPQRPSAADDTDRTAWHLLAMHEERLIGSIRLHIFQPHDADELAAQAVVNSGCRFSAADQRRCETAIADYTAQWRLGTRVLVQIGGLAVAKERRGTSVACALCLGANAFIREVGGRSGLVFAAGKSGNVRLYARSGCFALIPEDDPLLDTFHDDRVTVMGAHIHAVSPELDEVIGALGQRLRETARETV